MTAQIKALADEALKGDPAEVTTLGLLGIAAFEEQRYADAIGFWERLVSVLPNEDPARSAIQGGIQRARERMTEAGQTPPAPAAPAAAGVTLTVKVDISDAVKGQVKADDSVFVFARAVGGPPMPLAVKRLTVADLPAEVSLSDADAMMPQLKLSGFPQVELVARVSRAGNAISGEWIGRGNPLSTAQSSAQALTIDGGPAPGGPAITTIGWGGAAVKAKYLGLAILLGGLGGCVVHPPQTSEPPASLPPQSQPQPGPSSAPGATRRASPRNRRLRRSPAARVRSSPRRQAARASGTAAWGLRDPWRARSLLPPAHLLPVGRRLVLVHQPAGSMDRDRRPRHPARSQPALRQSMTPRGSPGRARATG